MVNQADPNKIANLKRAMSRASKLMNMTIDGTVDRIAAQKRDYINEAMELGGQTPVPQAVSKSPQSSTDSQSYSEQKIKASKIPSIIQESFLKTAERNNPSITASILDEINPIQIEKTSTIERTDKSPKTNINEASSNGAIDYPTIRAIMEDVVRKYTTSLKNKLLTESTKSSAEVSGIVLGKSFKFVANNGDLYEAKLTKIGNIHKK